MFGQKAQLPVDFLLGVPPGDSMPRSAQDWVDVHQQRLSSVYLHVKKQLQEATERRNRHHQPTATLLAPGMLVYRKSHPTGRHKIQDTWDSVVYMIVKNMDEGGRVYRLRPRDGAGPEKTLNRSELRVITAAPTNMSATQNQPVLDT